MSASGAANAASHAEEYALWGERIRLLFSCPPSYVESNLHQNPFERHSCCVPSHLSDVAPAAESPARSEATLRAPFQSAADTDLVALAGACGAYPDEELFPACFYARLLQSQRSAASMPSDALPGSASVTTLFQTQKLRVDEEDMAKRLAERLRERAALVRKRLHRLRTVPPSSLVSPFCDPKVEKQQAQLHSELTAFLLEVRRENLASVQLRHQLQHSRALHHQLGGVVASADSVPHAA
ncbi:hypothetical protein JIQ42_01250 [Leishmania sp. Namibia]|uniref:hypothetical protein n=1 Tax=Leishmania sp. Namibia TaxID=2802991 RepID=UPI001B70150E|nr:hypothetical protein JIQ42_01250 [Leishmania sp. Namibia]